MLKETATTENNRLRRINKKRISKEIRREKREKREKNVRLI